MRHITEALRAAIVEALRAHEPQTSIARRLRVSQGSVSSITVAEGLGGRRPLVAHTDGFVYALVTQVSGAAWSVEGTADDRSFPSMVAALSHAGAQGFRVVSANGSHSEFVMERAALERAHGHGGEGRASTPGPSERPCAPSSTAEGDGSC